jgi:hypothetical protein
MRADQIGDSSKDEIACQSVQYAAGIKKNMLRTASAALKNNCPHTGAPNNLAGG